MIKEIECWSQELGESKDIPQDDKLVAEIVYNNVSVPELIEMQGAVQMARTAFVCGILWTRYVDKNKNLADLLRDINI